MGRRQPLAGRGARSRPTPQDGERIGRSTSAGSARRLIFERRLAFARAPHQFPHMSDEQPPPQGVTGEPAKGEMDDGCLEPLGRLGLRHWQQARITQPGLEDRGSMFFAAVEMTVCR